MSHLVHAIQTSTYNSFKARSSLTLIVDKKVVLIDNVPFHKSREIQATFEDVGHIKSHAQWNDFRNPQTSLGHIDDIHAIVANMVQGWIRELIEIMVELLAWSNWENLIYDVPIFVK